MSRRGDTKKLLKRLERLGVVLAGSGGGGGGGHVVLRYEGRVVGTIGLGRCTRAAEKNVLAQLKRAGIQLDDERR